MKRTTSIIPDGWAKPYRKQPKINDTEAEGLGGVWAAIDNAPDPNRAERRRRMHLVGRPVRIRLFGFGQWRKRVVVGGIRQVPEGGDGAGYNGKVVHS